MERKLLKIDEACQYLGLSRPTLRKYLREGRIGFVDVNPTGAQRGVRFRQEDLDEYIERHVRGPKEG